MSSGAAIASEECRADCREGEGRGIGAFGSSGSLGTFAKVSWNLRVEHSRDDTVMSLSTTFRIFEEGRRQPISSFSQSPSPALYVAIE